jgi:hypothetical protein
MIKNQSILFSLFLKRIKLINQNREIMHAKRFFIATLLGAIFGAICAYGTKSSSDAGTLGFVATSGIIGSVFYNRLLLGMFIGLFGGCKLHPIIRGAFVGIVVSMGLGITPLLDGEPSGALIMSGAGAVIGIIIDLITSWLAKEPK